MEEQKRQIEKEKAIKLGIELGMALMRDDLKMYGMRADGSKEFICEAKDYDSLWKETVEIIERISKPEIEDKAQEYLDNWKRERADFVNYKKDETKRMTEFIKFSTEGIIMELIDVIDGIEVARKNVPDEEGLKGWLDGFDGALDRLGKFLEKFGVERMKVDGPSTNSGQVKFNPLLHEAVEVRDKDGDKIEEVRSGYTMHGKVIRPARVRIIK